MKKLLLSALAVCAFTFSNAQEEKSTVEGSMSKGDVMISGTAGFGATSNVGGLKDESASGYNFSPRAIYLVSDNIGVGLKAGMGSAKTEDPTGNEVNNQNLSAGLFGRYFFTPASKFSVFGELGFDYVSTNREFSPFGGTSTEAKNNGFDAAVGPGICYFVSEHFAIEANWGALSYKTRKDDIDIPGVTVESENDFNFNLDLADINFGLAYKF